MMPFLQTRTSRNFDVTHLVIESTKPFVNVRAFLEAVIPSMDSSFKRDYGAIIGYNAAAALYVPLRVLLYENNDGASRFEYDLPSSLFGQFGDDRITKVALGLDDALASALITAAE